MERYALNLKKINFFSEICYRSVKVEIRLQEQKLCGGLPPAKGSQKPFFDSSGQGGSIILVYNSDDFRGSGGRGK
jgi:hypothetical protein